MLRLINFVIKENRKYFLHHDFQSFSCSLFLYGHILNNVADLIK